MNMRTITFNELRKIKDSLPSGSMHRIADELGLNVDTVRNFFGGHNFKEGKSVGIHLEPGPDGVTIRPSGRWMYLSFRLQAYCQDQVRVLFRS